MFENQNHCRTKSAGGFPRGLGKRDFNRMGAFSFTNRMPMGGTI
jgi:hypothetical protein